VQRTIYCALHFLFTLLVSPGIAQQGEQKRLRELVITDNGPALKRSVNLINNLYGFCARPDFRDVVVRCMAVLLGLRESEGNSLKVDHTIEIGAWGRRGASRNESIAFSHLFVAGIQHFSMFVEAC
jgi:hypothetical protein